MVQRAHCMTNGDEKTIDGVQSPCVIAYFKVSTKKRVMKNSNTNTLIRKKKLNFWGGIGLV